MFKTLSYFVLCLAGANASFANGFDKMVPNMSILFEEGRHLEL